MKTLQIPKDKYYPHLKLVLEQLIEDDKPKKRIKRVIKVTDKELRSIKAKIKVLDRDLKRVAKEYGRLEDILDNDGDQMVKADATWCENRGYALEEVLQLAEKLANY